MQKRINSILSILSAGTCNPSFVFVRRKYEINIIIYSIILTLSIFIKGGFMVMSFYKGSVVAAVIDLFPEIVLDHARFQNRQR